MITIVQVELFYENFFSGKYRQKYKFRRTKTTQSVCESFLSLIDKEYGIHSLGPQFLWDYFLFQFKYWEDLELENKFSDKIVIAWIIGKKAFERWKARDKEFDWMIDKSDLIEKYCLPKKLLFTANDRTKKVNRGIDFSKSIRKQYLNTDRGFAICVQMTTLFDPQDISCITCKYRSSCKELLRVNYPNIYKERRIIDGGKQLIG